MILKGSFIRAVVAMAMATTLADLGLASTAAPVTSAAPSTPAGFTFRTIPGGKWRPLWNHAFTCATAYCQSEGETAFFDDRKFIAVGPEQETVTK
jgi:hypothetical protein